MRNLIVGPVVLLATLLSPGLSSAQVTVRSHHEMVFRVSGDDREYARVVHNTPLRLQMTGPAEVKLRFRQMLERGQAAGGSATGVSLMLGSRQVETFDIQGSTLESFVGAQSHRPTDAVEKVIHVPDGVHTYSVEVERVDHDLLVSFDYRPIDEEGLALASLAPSSDEDDEDLLPLATLTPSTDPEDDEDLPLATLVPVPDTESEDAEEEALLARFVDESKPDATPEASSGAVIGRPLQETPRAPRTTHFVLGVRALATFTTVGAGTMGPGLDLLIDNGLLNGSLIFGVSTDLVAHRLLVPYEPFGYRHGDRPRMNLELQTIPVMAVASYTLPFKTGPASWQIMAGAGPVLTNVGTTEGSNTAIHPGGVISAGPTLKAGPGSVSLAIRTNSSLGAIQDASGNDLINGLNANMGLTLGYVLSI